MKRGRHGMVTTARGRTIRLTRAKVEGTWGWIHTDDEREKSDGYGSRAEAIASASLYFAEKERRARRDAS